MLSAIVAFSLMSPFAIAHPVWALAARSTSPPPVESVRGDFSTQPHRDFANGVRELTGVVYSVAVGYRPLRTAIFLPPHRRGRNSPIVVFIHGGGWVLDPLGNEGVTGTGTLVALAARGYVVERPEYRLSSEAKFPAQLVDIKRAIRWMKTYAANYGGDTTRVVVWGGSAGGNLAALIGTTCGMAKFDEWTAGPKVVGLSAPVIDPHVTSCVNAVIDWYGPIDFLAMDSQQPPGPFGPHDGSGSPESRYVGCPLPGCRHGIVAAASPLTYIAHGAPPFLIMHGKADVAVPWRQSQELYDALRAHDVPAQLVLVDGANHMFEGVPAAAKKIQIQRVFRFIDAHSKRGR